MWKKAPMNHVCIYTLHLVMRFTHAIFLPSQGTRYTYVCSQIYFCCVVKHKSAIYIFPGEESGQPGRDPSGDPKALPAVVCATGRVSLLQGTASRQLCLLESVSIVVHAHSPSYVRGLLLYSHYLRFHPHTLCRYQQASACC